MKVHSELIAPLFSYDEPGTLPDNGLLIVSGENGTGKTTFLLQIAEKFARNGVPVAFLSCEMHMMHFKKLMNRIGCQKLTLDHVYFDTNGFGQIKELPSGTVIFIDSINGISDAFAKQKLNGTELALAYPDKALASDIYNIAKNNLVFAIQHYTKSKKVLSGSAIYSQINDVNIELMRDKENVLILARKKNRFLGKTDFVKATMTPKGLMVKEDFTLQDVFFTIKKRLFG